MLRFVFLVKISPNCDLPISSHTVDICSLSTVVSKRRILFFLMSLLDILFFVALKVRNWAHWGKNMVCYNGNFLYYWSATKQREF